MTDRLPNFIYIGPGKAGSTWLHETLIRHPQIYLSDAKELYFFDRYYNRGLDWYQSQFAQAKPEHRVVGEICQQYLFNADAPKRIHDTLGDVSLMVTIREPAARAFSSYLYMLKHGAVTGTFKEVLETRPTILNPSRYASHLKRYLEHFDESLIYCGVFDDLAEDPQRFLDPVLSWLDVDPMTLDDNLRAPRLGASRARSSTVARFVRDAANLARRNRSAKLIGYVKRSPLVHKVLYRPLDESTPRMSDDDARRVRDSLEGEIIEVEKMFGLDLRGRWGWV